MRIVGKYLPPIGSRGFLSKSAGVRGVRTFVCCLTRFYGEGNNLGFPEGKMHALSGWPERIGD